MSKSNENEPLAVMLIHGSIGASVAGVPCMWIPKKSKVLAMHIADKLGVAADNTNYLLVQVKVGSAVVAQLDTRAANQGALVAGVSSAMVVDPAVAGADHIAAGSDVSVDVTLHGTASLSDAAITMEYFPL